MLSAALFPTPTPVPAPTAHAASTSADTSSTSSTAVLCGPAECIEPVSFRAANEAAAAGRRVLCLRRAPRAPPALPERLEVVSRDKATLQDTFAYRPRLLQSINEISVNSMLELRSTLAMVQTLRHVPDLIIVERLSELIDPLSSTAKSDFEFLNQAMAARFFLDDTLAALQAMQSMQSMPAMQSRGGGECTRPCPRLLITDTCGDEPAYLNVLARGGANIAVTASPKHGSYSAAREKEISIEFRTPPPFAAADSSAKDPHKRVLKETFVCVTSDYMM
jgi:hypothetical protein